MLQVEGYDICNENKPPQRTKRRAPKYPPLFGFHQSCG